MTDRLAGKIALVTGAANGLGVAHVEALAREGAKVVATDIDASRGQELVARLGDGVVFVEHDVTDPGSWTRAVSAGAQAFGPIDVLVNNAGVSGTATNAAELTREEWDRTIEVDLTGTFLGVRALIPHMVEHGGGSIVNISSAAGMAAAPGVNAAYVAAKFGVRGLTKQIAIEFARQGVRANSLHPGAVRTELTQALADQLGPEFMEEFYSSVPMHRIAEASEVSDAVVFLASDESTFITGTELVIDGGLTAQ